VPRGIQADEKTVFTSDGGLKLEFVPQVLWVRVYCLSQLPTDFIEYCN
jgi:hypothetical protein